MLSLKRQKSMKMVFMSNKATTAAVLLLVVGCLASSAKFPANIRNVAVGVHTRNDTESQAKPDVDRHKKATAMPGFAELPANIQLIAVGGIISEGEETTTPDVDVISLSNNAHKKAAALPTGLAGFGRTVINNTFYVVGGLLNDRSLTNGFFAFSPTANVWARLPDFPVNIRQPATVAVDNVIYSFGGLFRHDHASPDVYFNYAYKYDTTRQVWLGITNPLPLTNVDISCAVAYKSDIYLLFETGELYRSSDGSNWSKKASLAHGRDALSCVALQSGSILVAGGWDNHDYSNLVDVYKVKSDSWSAAPSLTKNRAWADAVVISDEKHDDVVIVCGGLDQYNPAEPVYDSCELFSQKSNQWDKTQFSLDKPRFQYGLFAIQV